MQAPDQGDGRVSRTRLPSADRDLEAPHLAGDGGVICALPKQPRDRRHDLERDQQREDGHRERHRGTEDVEWVGERDGHRGTLGRWDRRSTRERARLSCAGPAFAECLHECDDLGRVRFSQVEAGGEEPDDGA